MSRSIFIQNSTGLQASDGDVNDPNAVADGKVVLLGIDGGGQIGLGDGAAEAPDRFLIVRGTGDSHSRRSGIINKADIKRASFEPYAAATPQVTTITFSTAGADDAGPLSLKLTRLDQGFEQYPRVNYEIQVEEGDTATQIADKFRAAIASSKAIQPDRHFVTATGTATLILTADSIAINRQGTPVREFISFVSGLSGDLGTIAATTSPFNGTGTFGQVRVYEGQSFGNMGYNITETPYAQRPEYHSASGTNYDLLTLEVKTNADLAINKSFEIHTHVIAVLAGQMSEETVLKLFGIEPDASPV